MLVPWIKSSPLPAVAASTVLLVLTVAPVRGQAPRPGSCPPQPCPTPAVEQPAPRPSETRPPETTPPTTTPQTPESSSPDLSLTPERSLALGGTSVAVAPGMKGDQLPIPRIAFAPPQTPTSSSQPRAAIILPSARTFKISDNESPQPRDRLFVDFNYYDDVGAAVDRRLGIDLRDIAVFRETFGVEKTFLDNRASLGLRLPLNTLSAESTAAGMGGTDTDMGDLTAILKYAFWRNADTGNLVSAGLAVTAPTGPNHFAGSAIPVVRDTVLEPFLGYSWSAGSWFVHGFSGINVPTDSRDVTLLFNSIGVGYIIARACPEERLLRAVVPTLEVHVSDPLNHRGAFKVADPAGTADVLNLTMAMTLELGQRSNLSFGIVTPTTGPKPFDIEALVQFNWYFGARGRGAPISAANVIGE